MKLKRDDIEKWDRIDPIRLIDAAHLWADLIPPGGEKPAINKAHQYFELLFSEIQKLPKTSHNNEPKLTDRYTRAEYQLIAENLKERPKFLYPEDRRRKTGVKYNTNIVRKRNYDEINQLINEKKYTIKKAAEEVAKRYEMKALSVERDYRRYRDDPKK